MTLTTLPRVLVDPFLALTKGVGQRAFKPTTSLIPLYISPNLALKTCSPLDLEDVTKSEVTPAMQLLDKPARIANLGTRLLRARTVMALEDHPMTKAVVATKYGIPLTLYGCRAGVSFAAANIEAVLGQSLEATLPPTALSELGKDAPRYTKDVALYSTFGSARVAAVVPVPGPLAGWSFYDGWIAIIGQRDAIEQAGIIASVVEPWIDGSKRWLEQSSVRNDSRFMIRNVRSVHPSYRHSHRFGATTQ